MEQGLKTGQGRMISKADEKLPAVRSRPPTDLVLVLAVLSPRGELSMYPATKLPASAHGCATQEFIRRTVHQARRRKMAGAPGRTST